MATKCQPPSGVTITRISEGKWRVAWSTHGTGGTDNNASYYDVWLMRQGGMIFKKATVNYSTAVKSYDFTDIYLSGAPKLLGEVRLVGTAGESYASAWAQSAYSTETVDPPTAPTAPTTITAVRHRNQYTITWSGAAAGKGNAIKSYAFYKQYSGSSTETYYFSIDSTATSGSTSFYYDFTNSTDLTLIKWGISTRGAISGLSSPIAWKELTGNNLPRERPDVNENDIITDTQMDNLRIWINTSGITDITDGSKVTATAGNTYKSGLTAGSSKIDSNWYYNAAIGS